MSGEIHFDAIVPAHRQCVGCGTVAPFDANDQGWKLVLVPADPIEGWLGNLTFRGEQRQGVVGVGVAFCGVCWIKLSRGGRPS